MIKKLFFYKYIIFFTLFIVLCFSCIMFLEVFNNSVLNQGQVYSNKIIILTGFIFVFILLLIVLIYRFLLFSKIIRSKKEEANQNIINNLSSNRDVFNVNKIEVNDLSCIINEDCQAKSVKEYAEKILFDFVKEINGVKGIFYFSEKKSNLYKSIAFYACLEEEIDICFSEGEGLVGQVVIDKKPMILSDLPESYLDVVSGLGNSKPGYLVILPVLYLNQTIGIIEVATFKYIQPDISLQFMEITEQIGQTLYEINNTFAK